jgi:hypothetical protein
MFRRFFFHVRCANTKSAEGIGAPLVFADYSLSKKVLFGAPCLLNANRLILLFLWKGDHVEEKTSQNLKIHCKKVSVFPTPAGMSLAGNNFIIPGQGEFRK